MQHILPCIFLKNFQPAHCLFNPTRLFDGCMPRQKFQIGLIQVRFQILMNLLRSKEVNGQYLKNNKFKKTTVCHLSFSKFKMKARNPTCRIFAFPFLFQSTKLFATFFLNSTFELRRACMNMRSKSGIFPRELSFQTNLTTHLYFEVARQN